MSDKPSIYEFNPNTAPDSDFEPGRISFLVSGNEGRLLDQRRTPVRVLEIDRTSGFFKIEILDFEDRGALWEVPYEEVDRYQFARGSKEAAAVDIAFFEDTISRLDQPLQVPANPADAEKSSSAILELRKSVAHWLATNSTFLSSGAQLNLSSKTGDPKLWNDLRRYMDDNGLRTIEDKFADQYVSNPWSGELIKGHCIVLAELGLAPFQGKKVRSEKVFSGMLSKAKRADHILHRLAFVREMFSRLGHSSFVLFRGFSFDATVETTTSASFVSATFSQDVAASHFNDPDLKRTGVLVRQQVPVDRLFMSYLETTQMNQRYKESEAVLLYEPQSISL